MHTPILYNNNDTRFNCGLSQNITAWMMPICDIVYLCGVSDIKKNQTLIVDYKFRLAWTFHRYGTLHKSYHLTSKNLFKTCKISGRS